MFSASNLSLRKKVLGFSIIPLLGVIAAVYLFVIPQAIQTNKAWIEKEYSDAVTRVADTLVPYVLQDNIASIWDTLDHVLEQEPAWLSARLYNTDNSQTYPLGAQDLPTSEAFLEIKSPVRFLSQDLGHLVVLIDPTEKLNALTTSLYGTLTAIVAAVLIGVAITIWWFDKMVTSPILSLSSATRKMSRGDFNASLPKRSNDEIGELLSDFDAMRSNIQSNQSELKEAAEKAEQANRAKTEFLSVMSHELRTPLTIIIGIAPMMAHEDSLIGVQKIKALLKEESIPAAKVTEALEELLGELKMFTSKIERSGEHLLGLINEILDLAKIESGTLVLHKDIVSVAQTLDFIQEQFKDKAQEKGIMLTLNAGDENAYADRQRLNQILMNLVGNAVKFTKEGEITIQSTQDDEMIRFAVKDTGIGIAPEHQESVFAKFSQGDSSSTRAFGGTGLGLAITRELVELHGGRISLESEPGRGSCFTFTIPAK